jgi:hypothetical protein
MVSGLPKIHADDPHSQTFAFVPCGEKMDIITTISIHSY